MEQKGRQLSIDNDILEKEFGTRLLPAIGSRWLGEICHLSRRASASAMLPRSCHPALVYYD